MQITYICHFFYVREFLYRRILAIKWYTTTASDGVTFYKSNSGSIR